MPIKWGAVKVSEAMDEVENQISLAEAFLADAKGKVRQARNIINLPGYMDDRLVRLITMIERTDYIKDAIKAVRATIPDGAIEAEQARVKHGIQQSLI